MIGVRIFAYEIITTGINHVRASRVSVMKCKKEIGFGSPLDWVWVTITSRMSFAASHQLKAMSFISPCMQTSTSTHGQSVHDSCDAGACLM
jgi:mannitol/fructose-specific phosphotransferase system IIA component (Ntr-type)